MAEVNAFMSCWMHSVIVLPYSNWSEVFKLFKLGSIPDFIGVLISLSVNGIPGNLPLTVWTVDDISNLRGFSAPRSGIFMGVRISGSLGIDGMPGVFNCGSLTDGMVT